MTEDTAQLTADNVWQQADGLFSNLRGMRPRLSWLTGLSVAAGRKRVERLTGSAGAARLMPKLAALSHEEFAVFQSYAQVNLEQSEAAMRLSLIANVTIPVGILVIANQFFPGIVQGFIDYSGTDATLAALGAAGTALFLAIWYCYAGLFQARDLAHLTVIAAARRSSPNGTGVRSGGTASRPKRPADEAAEPTQSLENLL